MSRKKELRLKKEKALREVKSTQILHDKNLEEILVCFNDICKCNQTEKHFKNHELYKKVVRTLFKIGSHGTMSKACQDKGLNIHQLKGGREAITVIKLNDQYRLESRVQGSTIRLTSISKHYEE